MVGVLTKEKIVGSHSEDCPCAYGCTHHCEGRRCFLQKDVLLATETLKKLLKENTKFYSEWTEEETMNLIDVAFLNWTKQDIYEEKDNYALLNKQSSDVVVCKCGHEEKEHYSLPNFKQDKNCGNSYCTCKKFVPIQSPCIVGVKDEPQQETFSSQETSVTPVGVFFPYSCKCGEEVVGGANIKRHVRNCKKKGGLEKP